MQLHTRSSEQIPCLFVHKKLPVALKESCKMNPLHLWLEIAQENWAADVLMRLFFFFFFLLGFSMRN